MEETIKALYLILQFHSINLMLRCVNSTEKMQCNWKRQIMHKKTAILFILLFNFI